MNLERRKTSDVKLAALFEVRRAKIDMIEHQWSTRESVVANVC
ncbi:MAG: hypothetical protein ACR2QX_13860 [Woeseiaceae bacterium]